MTMTAVLPRRNERQERRRHEAPAAPKWTPRELQLVKLLAVPYTGEECATIMGIKARTVKAHADQMARKLGTTRRRDIPRLFLAHTGLNPYPQGGEPL